MCTIQVIPHVCVELGKVDKKTELRKINFDLVQEISNRGMSVQETIFVILSNYN